MKSLDKILKRNKKYSTLAVISFILSFMVFLPYWGILVIVIAIIALLQLKNNKRLKGGIFCWLAISISAAQIFLTIYILYINKN